MTQKQDPLQIVGDFLSRFYHEEPNDTKASTKALKAMTGLFDYEWEVASAFKELLEMALPSGTLRDMVRSKANRHARSDEEAREFLESTYKDNDLDMAVNFKELSD
jgi:hypothetical protein